MRTRIISAFPGTGKTFFYNNNKDTCLDSDSSQFSWLVGADGQKIRNPDFPKNYIDHIKENVGKYEFILVSSHAEVRQALEDNCLFYYLAYPFDRNKDEYLRRYRDRGSDPSFIDLVDINWETWIRGCAFTRVGCKHLRMDENWYLTDEIRHLVCSENGER